MSIRVGLPDGSIAEFPDGTPVDVMQQAIARPGVHARAAETMHQGEGDPAEGMGWNKSYLAGLVGGVEKAGKGIAQLNMRYNPLWQGIPKSAQDAVDESVRDQKKYDAPLNDTLAGKIGEVVGGAIPTLPLNFLVPGAGPGATVAENFGRAILGGTVGGAAAGAVEPVEDSSNYGAEKAKQIAKGAALGAGINTGLKAAGYGLELAGHIPSAILNVAARGANNTALAREGEDLAQRTGVALTPGQVSGSKAMNMAENAARQSIFSREMAHDSDKVRVQQLSDYMDGVMDRITKSNAAPEFAGKTVQDAVKSTVSKLSSMRERAAAADYGAIRQLTNGAASINPENSAAVLRDAIDSYGGIGTPSADAVANFAKRQLANVDPAAMATKEAVTAADPALGAQFPTGAPATGNLDKLMKLRSYFSKVAGGQERISGDPSDRVFARNMLDAIGSDIDAAGEQIGGDLGGMLKTANARYRGYSQQIDSVHASPLGKILGDDMAGALQSGTFNTIAPEAVIAKMNKLQPSELGVVRGMLEKENPEAWAVFKRSILEDALSKAKQIPASEGVNTEVLRPNVLFKNLGDKKKLTAVFSPGEVQEIDDALQVARRLSDKTGYNFSNTAPMQELLQLVNGVKSLSVKGVASTAGQALGTQKIARLMANADGRRALLEISRLPPRSDRVARLAAQIGAIVGTDEFAEPKRKAE